MSDTHVKAADTPLLEVRGIRKTFGSVVALDDVSMRLDEGKTAAIVGDNGAGKSTLLKVITGVHNPDAGEILIEGDPVRFSSPVAAKEHGIEALFQDLALVNDLSIWQNVFLGRELVRGEPIGFQRKRAMAEKATEMLAALDVDLPSVGTRVRRLSGGQRQAVAIGRAVGWNARLTVMDEPTAALGVRERLEVESLIQRLREEGRTFLIISHNFEQVMRLSDEVWVMRHGNIVGHRHTEETTADELVALITGAKSSDSRLHVSDGAKGLDESDGRQRSR
jgi:simple sugar transport system ATP-binding protein